LPLTDTAEVNRHHFTTVAEEHGRWKCAAESLSSDELLAKSSSSSATGSLSHGSDDTLSSQLQDVEPNNAVLIDWLGQLSAADQRPLRQTGTEQEEYSSTGQVSSHRSSTSSADTDGITADLTNVPTSSWNDSNLQVPHSLPPFVVATSEDPVVVAVAPTQSCGRQRRGRPSRNSAADQPRFSVEQPDGGSQRAVRGRGRGRPRKRRGGRTSGRTLSGTGAGRQTAQFRQVVVNDGGPPTPSVVSYPTLWSLLAVDTATASPRVGLRTRSRWNTIPAASNTPAANIRQPCPIVVERTQTPCVVTAATSTSPENGSSASSSVQPAAHPAAQRVNPLLDDESNDVIDHRRGTAYLPTDSMKFTNPLSENCCGGSSSTTAAAGERHCHHLPASAESPDDGVLCGLNAISGAIRSKQRCPVRANTATVHENSAGAVGPDEANTGPHNELTGSWQPVDSESAITSLLDLDTLSVAASGHETETCTMASSQTNASMSFEMLEKADFNRCVQ